MLQIDKIKERNEETQRDNGKKTENETQTVETDTRKHGDRVRERDFLKYFLYTIQTETREEMEIEIQRQIYTFYMHLQCITNIYIYTYVYIYIYIQLQFRSLELKQHFGFWTRVSAKASSAE